MVLDWVHLCSPVDVGLKVASLVDFEDGGVNRGRFWEIRVEVDGSEFFIGLVSELVETELVGRFFAVVLVDGFVVGSEDLESVVIFRSTDFNVVVGFPLIVDVSQSSWVDINSLTWLVSEEEEASGKSTDDGEGNKDVLLHFCFSLINYYLTRELELYGATSLFKLNLSM